MTVELKYAGCNAATIFVNRSKFWTTHATACKQPVACGKVLDGRSGADTAEAPQSKVPRTLANSFAVPGKCADKFVEESMLAMVTGNISFNFFENEHLKLASSAIGIDLSSRKQEVRKYLPVLADKVLMATAERIDSEEYIDLSSDGWRKAHAQDGAPPANFMVLSGDKAMFHDVLDISGVGKDAIAKWVGE